MVAMDGWGRVSGAVIDRRSELGWTQKRLADEAGVAERTIQNLEAGKRPQPLIRTRIEKALGWEPGEFRRIAEREAERRPQIPKSLLREIENTEGLTPEERQAVIEAVERTLAKERGEDVAGPGAREAVRERRRPASL